nr:glutamate racemase [Actinobacillus delphinicola]
MLKPRILFFDSGIGGLSIYQEAKQLLPHSEFLYCLDNGAFPYSEKSEEMIIGRTKAICQKINALYPLDLIVIACNTASTIVLPTLREAFSFPIVGTVPAIKPAAQLSKTKHIALIATKGTVKRPYVIQLIHNFATDCQVEKFGSTLLVEMAENKLQGIPVNREELDEHIHELKDMADLDIVVLGCTHFPFIEEELRASLPQVKEFINSGKAIANRIQTLLDEKAINLNMGNDVSNKKLFATAPLSEAKIALFNELGFHLEKIIDV